LPETDIHRATLTNDINSNETKLFKSRSRRVTFDSALKHLRENAVSANPLILFFALPGLFLIPEKQLRRVFGSTGAWFLIAGGILYTVKPQLEFDRMLVILLLVFCVPAGKALERIFQHSAEFLLRRLAAALVAGFIFALPFTVSGIFQNRSVEQYYFGSQLLQELPKALKEFGGDGRILFSGFVLQDISGGHAAPLAAWSEKPLITSAFYHTQWWYTDVIPESFRNAGADGTRDFLNLYNVTAIAAHEPFWKHYFRSQPSEYNEVWHYENFVIFQRLNYESNYFVSGQGHVLSQSSHQVRMKLSSDTAIIKFNYYPFVKVEGCKVTPIEPSVGVRFTKLENCPTNVELTMESTSPWGRVLGNE